MQNTLLVIGDRFMHVLRRSLPEAGVVFMRPGSPSGEHGLPATRAKGPSVSSSTLSWGSRLSRARPLAEAAIAGLTENDRPAASASSATAGGPVYQCRTARVPALASRRTASRSAPLAVHGHRAVAELREGEQCFEDGQLRGSAAAACG